jgi:NitT/TauT family transport system substrate-binding protein
MAALTTSGIAADLKQIKFGFSGKAISPIIINVLVAEPLGYFKDEGLTVEAVPLGSNVAVMQNVVAKRIEFGAGTAGFELPILARGEQLPLVNFFEFTYPFKYAWAVLPDSPIKSISDLKGKNVGVSSFGLLEYPIGQIVLELAHIDPKKDVNWTAVGSGVTAGVALQKKSIDGLFYFDTGFGTIEAAGIPLRYLDLPENVPEIGGVFLSAHVDMMKNDPKLMAAFGRAVSRAELFVQTNPEAAAYLFIEKYPQAAPKGMPLADQVKAIAPSIAKRARLYSPFNKSVKKWGYMRMEEWAEEVKFGKFKLTKEQYGPLVDNSLIDEIDSYDKGTVRKQAKEFKLPFSKS